MSTSKQTTIPSDSSSSSNFTRIFDTAVDEYKKLTKEDLRTHPFATAFHVCNTPDTILDVFRGQAQAFQRFRKGDEKLMKWLEPTVHVLFTLSATLGEGIGLPFSPAKTIFTGIGVLLGAVKGVRESYDMLVKLFERVQFFLQRLNCYTGIPLTASMTELLGKILAHVLSILALSTKTMKERQIKTFLKKLVGRADIEDAVQRLDTLTKEEGLMTAARNLAVTHHVDDNVTTIKDVVTTTKDTTEELQRNQSREKLRTWLSPPNPSINHNVACNTHHEGTAMWFTQSRTFDEWKKNGSLLWIRGNSGSGKSILCSTIIEDIKDLRETKSALVAFYYFDFKDAAKRHLRGLLSSLLMQLGGDSLGCWDVLHQLYTKCRDGSEQPSEAALAGCLKNILDVPGQVPIYIIIDALDECPDTTGTPSDRNKVLDFVDDLVGGKHSTLYMCISSRPEQDIQSTLDPLTPTSRRVSLHEEGGQKEDINSYIRYFVHSSKTMQGWGAQDRELVIDTLMKNAGGTFRWVYCQLDTLSRCLPPDIRQTLNELPDSLEDTYKQTLKRIPKEKQQHAHRLLQCLVAAIRPLRVEELAQVFTIKFDADATYDMVENWRPENPEEQVFSACSTLVTSIDSENGKIVQFSHYSVKEFLTSDRFRTSDIGNDFHYYISLDDAHTTLARACLTVLLQLDETTDKMRLATFPLVFYAAHYWVDHAKFGDVASRIQSAVERLFEPREPYFQTWIWIRDVDGSGKQAIDRLAERPPQPEETPLYYAAFYGLPGLAKHLIVAHRENVNAKCGFRGSPLHAASREGHLDVARLLLDHGADVHLKSRLGRAPFRSAYDGRHLEIMRLLLEKGVDVDMRDGHGRGMLLHDASFYGQAGVARLLLEHKADVNARGDADRTPLHFASRCGHTEVVQVLLEYGADVNAKDRYSDTPFDDATHNKHHNVVQLLLEHGSVGGGRT